MLKARGLSKVYPLAGRPRALFEGLDFDVAPGERLGLLGRNGQGKSTLIKILGGIIPPTTGTVDWGMTHSWPLGFGGGFQGSLTGLDNIQFISRIYNRPFKECLAKAEGFAELGAALKMPFKYYSSGMRARLAFGLSLAIEFDCYLIDEIISVGDAAFRTKCDNELFGKRAHKTFVIASHDLAFMKATCHRIIIIDGGRAKWFDRADMAVDIYASLATLPDVASVAA
ncbi:MAG TPA: ABC transporter ATP-binding protein [Caulobacteraceae bacterium]|nr:ABC transporter ATP-binding protein [Caulobacteraceae bacterium]